MTAKRPIKTFQIPVDYAELVEAIAARRNRPIARASSKLSDFVNAAMSDADFRHPDCWALLQFLLLVRDTLADGLNEQWTIDDILEPIAELARKQNAQRAQDAKIERFAAARKTVIDAWLASSRRRGEKKRFADEQAKLHGVSADTIRKDWLSSKSLAEYQAAD